MQYVKFTYVDAVTGISIASEPAQNGPVFPPIAGLEFAWARESRYPTDVPEFFGTCPEDSNVQIGGVLGVYVQQDWETMRADEMRARVRAVEAKLSPLEVLDLFTLEEQLAVVEATQVSPQVKLWYDRLLAAEFIAYSDARTEVGLQTLVAEGLLTAPRKDEIVSAMQSRQ